MRESREEKNWVETDTNILLKKRSLVKVIQGQQKRNEKKDIQQLGGGMETQV